MDRVLPSTQSALARTGRGALVAGALSGAEAVITGGGRGGVIGGAVGGAIGGAPGGAFGGVIGGAIDAGGSGLSRAGKALKAGKGGLLGGAVSALASAGLGEVISDCECE